MLYVAAIASLTGLIALCIAWELWLAPLRPGGSWLVLKALPLLAPLFGLLHARTYTYRWSAVLMVPYFIEGSVRGYADSGLSAALAGLEVLFALTFIAVAVAYVRLPQQPRARRATSKHGAPAP